MSCSCRPGTGGTDRVSLSRAGPNFTRKVGRDISPMPRVSGGRRTRVSRGRIQLRRRGMELELSNV